MCHSGQSVTSQSVTGQSVTLAKVSPAKVSLAKVSLWPKCQQPKCLWPKYQQPKCLWPNCLWPKCLCGPNVPAKVSAAKVSFRPKCEPAVHRRVEMKLRLRRRNANGGMKLDPKVVEKSWKSKSYNGAPFCKIHSKLATVNKQNLKVLKMKNGHHF